MSPDAVMRSICNELRTDAHGPSGYNHGPTSGPYSLFKPGPGNDNWYLIQHQYLALISLPLGKA
ncbi:hypothetical protein PCASD_19910 [Puccinia coronata f. sp. avenae]|uniref:Uncharacterized protein n=1 Tax=Puccinia coronata f. sp. avenae TaxID=200324 RepID=A0A2N5U7S4_9BASI|nr:hypothetical protein PCASD_19910 [Puccinia coronata f. sp. avenae]